MKSKRTIKGGSLVLSVLLLLVGCTNEITQPGARSDGKARVNFDVPGIAEEVTTRAVLAENTTVRVVAYRAGETTYCGSQAYYTDASGKLKPCTVNADGSFKAVDTENELALLADTYDFYAYTPALPLSADYKSVTVPNGVDYASSVKTGVSVTTDMTLTLTELARKCSKIALVVKKADDNTAMTALSVASGGVTISALPTSQNVALNKDITPAKGTTTLDVPSTAFTLAGTTSTAFTYLLPRLGTDRMKIDYNLTYTVSGTTETKPVSGTMGNIVLEKGKSYTFTLTMRKTGASLSVTDWIESNQEVVTGESLDYTDNGKPWFLIAARDAKNPVNGTETMNWYQANGVVDATTNPDGKKACPDGWRVPTRDEIAMLWIYSKTLAFDKAAYYWSSTAGTSSSDVWMGYFYNGVISENVRTGRLKTRCIRSNSMANYPRVETDKQTIISRDATGGVKETLTLTSAQITWLNTTNTSTTGYNEQSDYNKVSPKLQVAIVDCTTSNSTTASSGTTLYNWANAYTACKAYTENSSGAGSWRLPTQRELMLIYNVNNKLQNPITLGTTFYWTGTESSSNTNLACYLIFANKTLTGYLHMKTYEGYVRCVRDVQ